MKKPSSMSRLTALASLTLGTSLVTGATDPALVDLLVANGVISSEQAAGLDRGSDAATDPALIALLVQSGALTQAQADSLQAAPSATPAPASAPAASAPSVVVKPKEKTVQSLTISGRIHAQMDYLRTDYENASSPDDEFNLFLRRVYLGAKAKFADGLSATVNANFGTGADGVAELEKAVVDWSFSPEHNLVVGFQKAPFGFEETTSSSKILGVERSIATRYFTEQLDYGARHAGLYLNGAYDSGLSFSLGVTSPEQGDVAGSGASDSAAFWARTEWSTDLGGATLDLGLNGGYIPNQRFEGSSDYVWGFRAATQVEALRLELEYLAGQFEDAKDSGDATPQAFHLIASYQLDDAFQFVGRYAHIDADGGVGADISSTFRRAPESGSALYDSVDAFYLGGNWYIRGNGLKLSAGYEWASYDDNLTGSQGDADVSGLRTRLQLLF